jgi:hypothetical protein
MDGYHIALYIHLLALVSAACASSLVHFAEARRGKAVTPGEALQWHRLVGVTSRTFPIAILLLLATGSYMVSTSGNALWATGWVKAGVIVSVLLFVVGGVIGARAKRMSRTLAELAQSQPAAAHFPRHDSVIHMLSWLNSGMAVGIVGVMAMKPSVVGSTAIVAAAALLGVGISMRGGHATEAAAGLAQE